MRRRTFIKASTALLASPTLLANNAKSNLNIGCASGDVTKEGAMIWSRADRASQMWVDVATQADFNHPLRFKGTQGNYANDFNLHCEISGLSPGQSYFYRVYAESLSGAGQFSEPLLGQFMTASDQVKPIRLCWSGDVVGQGYGIDKSRGGMRIFQTMLEHQPDFFVHSGDQIYADNPLEEYKPLDDGSVWQSLVTAGKSHVAETVQDFRDNFYYNYLDEHYRRFFANVPVYQQWDDHEVINNWYPQEILNDTRYTEKSVAVLAQHAKQAMFDCNPMRNQQKQQVYRHVKYGPLLDLFILDMRSFRGPNSANLQAQASAETDFLGKQQLDWLKSALAESEATWKIICSDMPIGLIVKDWPGKAAENAANRDGPPLGRELEIAGLLSFIHQHKINNTHFITADVHYCASHFYDPAKAVYKDFSPFWEFVSGPLYAGTFGPSRLDNTFGPQVKFMGIPEGMKPNRPPSDGFQFFGQIDINHKTQAMTVSHYDVNDRLLWSKTLEAE